VVTFDIIIIPAGDLRVASSVLEIGINSRSPLSPQSIKRTSGRSADLADSPTDSYSPLRCERFFRGISWQQTGRRRALVTIVNGSTERAKTRKIYSSQSSTPHLRTHQHLPRMMPRQLSTNLDGSPVSSRSGRRCRWIQRRPNRPRNRSRYGRRRSGARPARYLPPNSVVSAL
jgi:hypothetical protein